MYNRAVIFLAILLTAKIGLSQELDKTKLLSSQQSYQMGLLHGLHQPQQKIDIKLVLDSLNYHFHKLDDETFCLYKGIAIKELQDGHQTSKYIYASMAGHKRSLQICQTQQDRFFKAEEVNDSLREISQKETLPSLPQQKRQDGIKITRQ